MTAPSATLPGASRFASAPLALPGGALVGLRRQPGRGLPVLLLHGISSGAGSWAAVAAALPQRPLVAWDAPGYGSSTPLPAARPMPADYAARAAEVLDALGLPRVLLVGHSLGALVAAALAAAPRARGRIAGLLLISPARGYGHDAAKAAQVRTQRLQALAEQGIDGLAAGLGARLLSTRADAAMHAALREVALRMTPGGHAQAVEMLAAGDLAAFAPALAGLPRRVLVGSADVVTPPEACEALARALGAPFATLPGAGHASPVEQPEAVARAIDEFAEATEADAGAEAGTDTETAAGRGR